LHIPVIQSEQPGPQTKGDPPTTTVDTESSAILPWEDCSYVTYISLIISVLSDFLIWVNIFIFPFLCWTILLDNQF